MKSVSRWGFECFLVVWVVVCLAKIAIAEHDPVVVKTDSHDSAGQMADSTEEGNSEKVLLTVGVLPTLKAY